MKNKMNMIHYIDDNYKTKFIIAKTNCGKNWEDVNEFTSIKEEVSCKKCKNDFKKMDSKK
jgi:hypothetical protein